MEPTHGERTVPETGVVRSCAVETPAVRSLFSCFDEPRTVWGSPTTTVVTGGATAVLTASGPDRFQSIRDAATDLFDRLDAPTSLPDGARPRLFGGFSFSDSQQPAPESRQRDGASDDAVDKPWEGYANAAFVLPAVQVSISSDGTWITTVATGPDATETAERRLETWRARAESLPVLGLDTAPGVDNRRRSSGLDAWESQIDSVVDRIERDELRKVVLAQSLHVALESTPRVIDVLTRLGESYPSCYQFLFEPQGGNAFFGVTPERLVGVRSRTVDTVALAGSIGRGETRDEDEWLAKTLRESEKNTHEHDLVVEAIRDQLTDVASDIETGTRTVRKLATVQHLQTPIRATLNDTYHVVDIAERLHPTPAVGGLPPDEATETIRDLEGFDRGWYASPVGWIDAAGNGTFAVAIRSSIIGQETATLFAGAGIVSDSNPHEEWDELQLKFRPILDELETE